MTEEAVHIIAAEMGERWDPWYRPMESFYWVVLNSSTPLNRDQPEYWTRSTLRTEAGEFRDYDWALHPAVYENNNPGNEYIPLPNSCVKGTQYKWVWRGRADSYQWMQPNPNGCRLRMEVVTDIRATYALCRRLLAEIERVYNVERRRRFYLPDPKWLENEFQVANFLRPQLWDIWRDILKALGYSSQLLSTDKDGWQSQNWSPGFVDKVLDVRFLDCPKRGVVIEAPFKDWATLHDWILHGVPVHYTWDPLVEGPWSPKAWLAKCCTGVDPFIVTKASNPPPQLYKTETWNTSWAQVGEVNLPKGKTCGKAKLRTFVQHNGEVREVTSKAKGSSLMGEFGGKRYQHPDGDIAVVDGSFEPDSDEEFIGKPHPSSYLNKWVPEAELPDSSMELAQSWEDEEPRLPVSGQCREYDRSGGLEQDDELTFTPQPTATVAPASYDDEGGGMNADQSRGWPSLKSLERDTRSPARSEVDYNDVMVSRVASPEPDEGAHMGSNTHEARCLSPPRASLTRSYQHSYHAYPSRARYNEDDRVGHYGREHDIWRPEMDQRGRQSYSPPPRKRRGSPEGGYVERAQRQCRNSRSPWAGTSTRARRSRSPERLNSGTPVPSASSRASGSYTEQRIESPMPETNSPVASASLLQRLGDSAMDADTEDWPTRIRQRFSEGFEPFASAELAELDGFLRPTVTPCMTRGRLELSARSTIRVHVWLEESRVQNLEGIMRACLARGMPFRLWTPVALLPDFVPSGSSRTWITPPYLHTVDEVMPYTPAPQACASYLSRVYNMLLRPHAQRFLTTGGLLWRIALQFGPSYLYQSALMGPSVDASLHLAGGYLPDSGEIDDSVSDSEIGVLLGAMRGVDSDQQLYAWPPLSLWEASGWKAQLKMLTAKALAEGSVIGTEKHAALILADDPPPSSEWT
ncbi:hypothetical protein BJ138DRAFT_1119975 [Hygrophoropsis aurantiaca]|uniref:Uncharacterized protein n=1 Tax=Hygrophoropsis aurantiaca TaxID=72124 RepID=A0ACB7ZST9_9AGAM|nr:hypothetical protein BJ138DRAFT_1119975 [Hygrophoropsis aurantiaca]